MMSVIKMNKNKGFSIIELLGVVVILGILSAVTIVSIRYLREKAKTNHYHSLSTNLVAAAQNYVNDNPSDLPRSIGQGSQIKLRQLIDNKYIEELKDFNKKQCDSERSMVDIFKYSKDKYSYKVTLFCPNYNSVEQPKYSDGPEIEIISDSVIGKVDIKIVPVDQAPPSDENKILSYKYVVSYQDDSGMYVEKINSGDIEPGLVDEVTKTIEFDTTDIFNVYEITVTAVDIYGNVSLKSGSITLVDNIPPACPEGSTKNKNNIKTIAEINSIPTDKTRVELFPSTDGWINTNRSITIHCNGTDCVENIIIIEESETIATIEVSDTAGNVQTCYVPVYVDKDPPVISNLENSYGDEWAGPDSLEEKPYRLTIEADDELSGINNYSHSYPYSSNSSEHQKQIYADSEGLKTFVTPNFIEERNENVKIEVCDNVGNCSSIEEPIRIDKTPPTLTITNPYLNVWPTKANVVAGNYKLTLNSVENGSGIAGYSYQFGTTKKNYSDSAGESTFVTTPFKTERDENVTIEVCDNVGNCSSGTSLIKIDTTPPSIPTIVATYNYDSTKAEGSKAEVYESGDVLSFLGKVFLADRSRSFVAGPTSEDNLSGVKEIQISKDKSSWTPYAFNELDDLYYVTDSGIHTRYFRAVDNAGNVSGISNFSVTIDNDPLLKCPTYTVVKQGTTTKVSKESWVNSKLTVKYNFSNTSATSYIWDVRTGEEGAWSNNSVNSVPSGKSVDVHFNANGIRQGRLTISDGTNTKVCPTNYYYIDKEKPNCDIELDGTQGESGWYKAKNVTVTLKKSDDISGVSTYDLSTSSNTSYNKKSSATQGDTNGITYYAKVKDRAGNVQTCQETFKVDKTKPTCSLSVTSGTKGSNGWYKTNVTVSLTKRGDTRHGMSTSNSVNYNSKTSLDRTSDTSGSKYYGFVKDAAGNTGTCNLTVKVDKTNPPCKLVIIDGTKGDNGWYTSNVTFGFQSLSGVSSYGMATTNSPIYNKKYDKYTVKSDSNKVYYGFTKAESGRVSSCSLRVKLDKTPPTDSISPSAGKYAKGTTGTLKCADGLSGLAALQVSLGTSKKKETKKSSISFTLSATGTYKFVCKDKAGNKKSATRAYTVTTGCPAGEDIFGTAKASHSGNWLNQKVYANEYFDDNWCYDNTDVNGCWAHYGYPRVSVAAGYYKGKTAKEITEKTGCYYAPYWCKCYSWTF